MREGHLVAVFDVTEVLPSDLERNGLSAAPRSARKGRKAVDIFGSALIKQFLA